MSNRDDSGILGRIRDAFQPAPNDLRIEREALEAFYHATNGDDWSNNTNWLSSKPLGEWAGVTVNESGRVVGFGFGFSGANELSGEIPPELGNLSNLEALVLSSNQLSGDIPPELGNLSNLRMLDLWGNRLSGDIPPELGNLSKLRSLDLWGNRLSGEIPPALGNLSNLDRLDLRVNQLSGEIPPALGNLSNLRSLSLWGNRLSGAIPAELGNLSNLAELSLADNQLSGSIPPELGNLSNLDELPLGHNQLSGAIPPELGNMYNLKELSLLDNRLSGAIPAELGNLSNLRSLSLWGNRLSGEIPSALGNLSNLVELALSDNQLSGQIPPELGNLSNLAELRLADNQLTGCLPKGLRDIEYNDLDELGLPDCGDVIVARRVLDTPPLALAAGGEDSSSDDRLSDRQALTVLYRATNGDGWTNNANWLSDKPLSEWHGVMADSEGRVTALLLPNNGLSGELPSDLTNLSDLQALYLAGNPLTGCVPQGLRDVPNNDLASLGLPDCGAASDRAVLETLYRATNGDDWSNNANWLSDKPLSEWNGVMADSEDRVTALLLPNNGLSGELPSDLGNLSGLQALYLAGNHLTGCIPLGLRDVPNNDLASLGLPDCS